MLPAISIRFPGWALIKARLNMLLPPFKLKRVATGPQPVRRSKPVGRRPEVARCARRHYRFNPQATALDTPRNRGTLIRGFHARLGRGYSTAGNWRKHDPAIPRVARARSDPRQGTVEPRPNRAIGIMIETGHRLCAIVSHRPAIIKTAEVLGKQARGNMVRPLIVFSRGRLHRMFQM